MASNFTSFSSPTSSTLTSTTSASTATSSSSSSDSTNAGIPSKGANYFFGFLITFIVLLSFFICCGFGTRRSLARRRALLSWGQWDSDSMIGGDDASDVPTLFEPRFMKNDNDTFWLSIQPLTAQKVTVPPSINPDNDSTPLPPLYSPPPVRRPSRNPNALHGLSLPTWLPATALTTSSSNNELDNSKRNGKGISRLTDSATVVQVAVVIAMPCRPGIPKVEVAGEDECVQKNMEIGVACEAWDSSAHIRASEGELS
ncbi:hypothetical protein J3R30DRAFT_3514906 [Lentinula aciculospora]|uniref:Uncharacterized protein n=1 Tax=Lentinula aciculospora TaxID=153920 RepID=A0A9W9A414_9AGAR|nr:hypothetical protein J3R30DRAFT_3514906 [Lentinula aciculospora]